jgi:hypothetical protein
MLGAIADSVAASVAKAPEKLNQMVRSRRLELPRGYPHKHLKLARLPFRHDRTGRRRGIPDE